MFPTCSKFTWCAKGHSSLGAFWRLRYSLARFRSSSLLIMTLTTFARSKSFFSRYTEHCYRGARPSRNCKPGIVLIDLHLTMPHVYMASDEVKTRSPESYTVFCNKAINPQIRSPKEVTETPGKNSVLSYPTPCKSVHLLQSHVCDGELPLALHLVWTSRTL